MNRRDRAIVAALVCVLAVLAGVIAVPAAPSPEASGGPEAPTPAFSLPPETVYREGVVGVPVSITPVTARSRAERTLVGLVFSGLVRLGPGTSYEPDLADSWTVDKTGRTWTFHLGGSAVWQDGEPVTSTDALFTLDVLKSPEASGAALAAQWADVTAEAPDDSTVVYHLGTPVAGWLAAATQPILPAHLLAEVPFTDLASSEYARMPVGSGPFALTEIDDTHAVLAPKSMVLPEAEAPASSGSPAPTLDSLATPVVRPAPAVATPYLGRIEIRFYPDEGTLAAAMRTGEISAAAGLSPATIADLSSLAGMRLTRYPTTTLTAVLLNLRATHPELRSAAVRTALLQALDRDALLRRALDGNGLRADALVPPTSALFDGDAVTPIAYDRASASKALKDAGWTRQNGLLHAPKAKDPYTIHLLSVTAEANPKVASIAEGVKTAWQALGFTVDLEQVPVAELGPRLRDGDFGAAVIDIAEGLEPDLFPLLASSQVQGAGSNLAGYQDPALDDLLEAARKPGSTTARQKAWKALLAGLSQRLPLLPLVWTDEVVVSVGLEGLETRLITRPGDRYWDVLAWRLAANR